MLPPRHFALWAHSTGPAPLSRYHSSPLSQYVARDACRCAAHPRVHPRAGGVRAARASGSGDGSAVGPAVVGARPAAEVVIAEVGGAAVGFALFFHNFSTFLGRPGLFLEDLYVQPQARGGDWQGAAAPLGGRPSGAGAAAWTGTCSIGTFRRLASTRSWAPTFCRLADVPGDGGRVEGWLGDNRSSNSTKARRHDAASLPSRLSTTECRSAKA